jgi:hypothetical protein
MTFRLIRRIAIALLTLYAFGQASVALAACGMERGAMAQVMAMPAGDTCEDCAKADADSVTPLCVAHCTADLQLTAAAPDALPAAAIADPLMTIAVPRFRSPPVLAYLPPGAPPRRILLHSFQV